MEESRIMVTRFRKCFKAKLLPHNNLQGNERAFFCLSDQCSAKEQVKVVIEYMYSVIIL